MNDMCLATVLDKHNRGLLRLRLRDGEDFEYVFVDEETGNQYDPHFISYLKFSKSVCNASYCKDRCPLKKEFNLKRMFKVVSYTGEMIELLEASIQGDKQAWRKVKRLLKVVFGRKRSKFFQRNC